jgi:hypothetical protein
MDDEYRPLPDNCWKCGAAEWIGEQTVTPPQDLDRPAWHRRTRCRFCGGAQDEIRGGTLVQLVSRDQPIPWQGGNPFA